MYKKHNLSLITIMFVCGSVISSQSFSAIKIGNNNRSYSNAYNQVSSLRQQQEYMDATQQIATTQSATDSLPVRVADSSLAEQIINNTSASVTMDTLNACSMIYPNGKFEWAKPQSGIKAGSGNQCVSVVELRTLDKNTGAEVVLATTTLSAGDSMNCNIEEFPKSGYFETLSSYELPADREPTIEEVEKVMNAEQKQNAGFKIAAGAIIGGLAGNLLAKKDAGDTKLLGTGKEQLKATALGMLGAGGVMAASSYSGKVAGDTIQSTAINAAAGMVVGNMAASGSDSGGVLKIEKCKIDGKEYDCVPGVLQKTEDLTGGGFLIVNSLEGVSKYLECTTKESEIKCVPSSYNITDIKVAGFEKEKSFSDSLTKARQESGATCYKMVGENTDNFEKVNCVTANEIYYKITAKKATDSKQVYAVLYEANLLSRKAFGHDKDDLKDDDIKSPSKVKFYYRNSSGEVDSLINEYEDAEKRASIEFKPQSKSADDGAMVDLSNEARKKGTLAGAGVGAAMGGLSGYKGAKAEVTDRWTEAVRLYKDSLSNVYCATGTRYLSQYNDVVTIEPMKTE